MATETVHHVFGEKVYVYTRGEFGWLAVEMSARERICVFLTDPAHARRLADDMRAMADRWDAMLGEKAVTV